MNGIFALLTDRRVRLVVTMFGRTNVVTGILEKYSKPFIQLKTPQGTRILNEFVVREINPLKEAEA